MWDKHIQETIGSLSRYFYSRRPLLERILSFNPSSVLEIGVGSGLLLIDLTMRNVNVVGLDYEKDVLLSIRKRQLQFDITYPIIHGNMFNLPFQDNSIHVVCSQGVIEHYEPKDTIRAIREHGRVGKITILDIPTEKWPNDIGVFGDERFYTWREWIDLIQQGGLKVIDRYGWGISPHFKNLFAFLPPYLFNRLQYRFTQNVGFICRKMRGEI